MTIESAPRNQFTCDNRLRAKRFRGWEPRREQPGVPRVKITQPSPPGAVWLETAEFDVDALIEPVLLDAVAALDGRAPLLSGMVRYHLGYAGRDLRPLDRRAVDRGKRMRPAVALLAAGAAGGEPRAAAPVAAALELLHNFSLIHDDIQDESPIRRHRPTVWSLWGVGQAINAGDALFAAAHLPLYRLASSGVTADLEPASPRGVRPDDHRHRRGANARPGLRGAARCVGGANIWR